MSQTEMIKRGQIEEKKQQRAAAVIAAKAALRSLGDSAVYTRNKPVEEINTAELTAHLEQLIAKQKEVKRIDEEIKELNY